MKKIILVLFLFFLCYACYFIYNHTESNKKYILAIGDEIAANPCIKDLNTDFTNKDYHLNDLVNIIKYNEEIEINDKYESIHKLLKQADILIISIGMNDIYYKLNEDIFEIYTYLNNLINEYEELLKLISHYDYQQVYILNYYNISNKNTDLFTYINYKLNKLTTSYNYTYLDISKILNNNSNYYLKNSDFSLNNKGYCQIFNLMVEKTKKTWYNIKCVYYYDLY